MGTIMKNTTLLLTILTFQMTLCRAYHVNIQLTINDNQQEKALMEQQNLVKQFPNALTILTLPSVLKRSLVLTQSARSASTPSARNYISMAVSRKLFFQNKYILLPKSEF